MGGPSRLEKLIQELRPAEDFKRLYRMPEFQEFNYMSEASHDAPPGFTHAYLMAHYIGGGPKLFKPTKLQCESFESTRANYMMEDYQQPFDTMAMAFEEGPCIGAIVQSSKKGFVFVFFMERGADYVGHLVRQDMRMETALTRFYEEFKRKEFVDLAKIIFNGFYILTQVRTETKKPIILPDVERIRKAKKPPEVLVKRYENLQSFQPTVVSFHQEVEIVEKSSIPNEAHTTGGWKVHPHFRSGCFTNQPHGQGRSERKRIWRRPSFVNKDRFSGDLANTKVTLTTKGN